MAEQTEKQSYQGWADLQIMGHIRHMGYVSEAPMFGTTMVQIQTINRYTGEPGKTLYYSPTSIYSIELISEEQMRADIARVREEVRRRDEMMAARQLAPVAVTEEYGDPDEGDEPDPRDRF